MSERHLRRQPAEDDVKDAVRIGRLQKEIAPAPLGLPEMAGEKPKKRVASTVIAKSRPTIETPAAGATLGTSVFKGPVDK